MKFDQLKLIDIILIVGISFSFYEASFMLRRKIFFYSLCGRRQKRMRTIDVHGAGEDLENQRSDHAARYIQI